jgi:hypothetical protein
MISPFVFNSSRPIRWLQNLIASELLRQPIVSCCRCFCWLPGSSCRRACHLRGHSLVRDAASTARLGIVHELRESRHSEDSMLNSHRQLTFDHFEELRLRPCTYASRHPN